MSMKSKTLALLSSALTAAAVWPLAASAALPDLRGSTKHAASSGSLPGTEGTLTLPDIIGNVVAALLSFIGVILLVLIIYGGFLWMTAQGNTDQVTKARKILTSAVIGMIIVLSAYIVTSFIVAAVVSSTAGNPTG